MGGPWQLLADERHSLGEGVLWCERSGRVFWTSIHQRRLHSLRPADGARQVWKLPERLCSFALTESPERLLLALATGLAWLDLNGGRLTPIMHVERDLSATRLNDGRCDRQGRFVFGTMDERADKQAIGGYYRLNPDLTLERLPLPSCAIANSICFSLDGDTMYYCDTARQLIERWDGYAGPGPGRVSVHVDLRGSAGWPDGSTIDAEGCLWNAQWGGGRVVRYGPDGAPLLALELPVSQPSCVCLGGADYDRLFVTSAREGLDGAALAGRPEAGGLFGLTLPGARGVPESRFGTTF